MVRILHLPLLCLFALATALAGCGDSTPPPGDATESQSVRRDIRPNVVWILLDACRADHLSAYGYHRPTSPNIDALAARGVLFERNFSQGPNTPQSMRNFMTGRYAAAAYYYPGAMGHWFLRRPPPQEAVISSIFAENGYDTAMFSSSPWYIEGSRLAKSFGRYEWLQHDEKLAGDSYRERHPALFAWLGEKAGKEQPFLLFLHTLDTHGPRYRNNTDTRWLDPGFDPGRDAYLRSWDELALTSSSSFSPADREHLTNLYDGGVAYADSTVGEVVAALDGLGISDNTWVIISADHGELLAEDGKSFQHPPRESYDELLHVPLIISGPGLPRGKRVSVMTQNADVVPTLVDLLSLESHALFDGKSMRPLLEQKRDIRLHEFVAARTQGDVLSSAPGRVVIFDDTKYDFSAFGTGPIPENVAPRPEVLVFAMPDRLGQRRPISPVESQAARAMQIVAEVLVPLRETLDSQPIETPPYFQMQLDSGINEQSVVGTRDPTDGLWSREGSPYADALSNDWMYVSSPWSEKAPGLIFNVDIPNGTYRVSAFCMTVPTTPPRGSSFSFSLPYLDPTPRIVGLASSQDGAPASALVELGTYTVTDGRFEIWVDKGHPEDNAVIGHLTFRTEVSGDAQLDPEETVRRKEQLKALGYVE